MILFSAYIIELKSYDLVVCVALEACSMFFQTEFFPKCFSKVLPAIVPNQTNMIYSVQDFFIGVFYFSARPYII